MPECRRAGVLYTFILRNWPSADGTHASLWPGQDRVRVVEKFNGLIGEYIRNRIRIRSLAIK